MQTQEQRNTLHVAKVTRRVVVNRQAAIRNPGITFAQFRKGLVRAFEFDVIAMSRYPKGYWLDQYNKFREREALARGRLCVTGLDAKTVDAFEWVHKQYSPSTIKPEVRGE